MECPRDFPFALLEVLVIGVTNGFVHFIFEVSGILVLLRHLGCLFHSRLGHHFGSRSLLLGHLDSALDQLVPYWQGGDLTLELDRLGGGLVVRIVP